MREQKNEKRRAIEILERAKCEKKRQQEEFKKKRGEHQDK